jgi:hypothetical protein
MPSLLGFCSPFGTVSSSNWKTGGGVPCEHIFVYKLLPAFVKVMLQDGVFYVSNYPQCHISRFLIDPPGNGYITTYCISGNGFCTVTEYYTVHQLMHIRNIDLLMCYVSVQKNEEGGTI